MCFGRRIGLRQITARLTVGVAAGYGLIARSSARGLSLFGFTRRQQYPGGDGVACFPDDFAGRQVASVSLFHRPAWHLQLLVICIL